MPGNLRLGGVSVTSGLVLNMLDLAEVREVLRKIGIDPATVARSLSSSREDDAGDAASALPDEVVADLALERLSGDALAAIAFAEQTLRAGGGGMMRSAHLVIAVLGNPRVWQPEA